MRAVPVERRADELLVRVETLPLPPHVARTLEHLLERALPHLERSDEGFKLLKVHKKVSKIDMGFFQNLMLGKKCHVDMRCPMLTPMSTWDISCQHGIFFPTWH